MSYARILPSIAFRKPLILSLIFLSKLANAENTNGIEKYAGLFIVPIILCLAVVIHESNRENREHERDLPLEQIDIEITPINNEFKRVIDYGTRQLQTSALETVLEEENSQTSQEPIINEPTQVRTNELNQTSKL